VLKARTRLGKYRIDRKIGEGGFAVVYRAYDLIEDIPVALKIPHTRFLNKKSIGEFKREVRIAASLEHPHILPIKNAMFIGKLLVIASPLGEESLEDRLSRRLALRTALSFTEQMISAVAFAHASNIIHRDIKPDNFILFPEQQVKLSDFGIAKIAFQTRALSAGGTGTLGYLSPEQALGKPSFRSDVFSLGLVLYRMFAGVLPEWPYKPLPGGEKLRRSAPPEFIDFLRKCIQVDERLRYQDGLKMQSAFERIQPRFERYLSRKRRSKKGRSARRTR
jgi:serine/threonine-protein kinase